MEIVEKEAAAARKSIWAWCGGVPPVSGRIVIVLASLVLATAVACVAYYYFYRRPELFVAQWSREFRRFTSLDGARRLEKGGRVWVKTFPNGEWLVATCEHSCCSGAGFDATIIRDSTGAILVDRTHTSCGVQGMIFEMEAVPGDSLSAFYAGAGHLMLERE